MKKSLMLKKNARPWVMIFFFCCIAQSLFAQEKVRGVVKDTDGGPIPGASIRVLNSSSTSITDEKGNFEITTPNLDVTLVISHLNYITLNKPLNKSNYITAILEKNNNTFDEVVVTGYTSQQKKDIIGSVSVVDMKALKDNPSVSVDRALQGMASGVNVVSSGVPGSTSKINIRGLSSFGDSQPLTIVDGIEQSITHINPNDIESIQVLKDAGAAAIYGVRGANGILIITTKKGKSGLPTVNYEGNFTHTMPHPGNVYDLLNSNDYMDIYNKVFPGNALFSNGMPDYTFRGPNGAGVAMEGDPAVDPSLYFYEKKNSGRNYIIQKVNKEGEDWFHNIFRPANSTQHVASVSGGGENNRYYFGLGYLDQNGTLYKSYYKRYSARINTEFNIGRNIRIGENLNLLFRQKSNGGNGMGAAYQMLPIVPLRDIMGNYAGTFGGPSLGSFSNSVANQERDSQDINYNWGIAGNVFADVKILKNLVFTTSLGVNYGTNYERNFEATQTENVQGSSSDSRLIINSSYSNTLTFTNTLKYNNNFNLHNIQLLAGTEAISYIGKSLTGGASNLFIEDESYLNLNNGTVNITNGSSVNSNSLFSIFGRVDYDYSKKYLASITLRRDGSSKFGSNRRYGVFPSYSIGWRISEEKFLNSVSWIDELKLKASHGVLGSQNNVNSANAYSLYAASINGTGYDIMGTGNSVVQGFAQSRIGNLATGWEENILTNIGVDFQFLKNYTFNIEYYKKKINGLLFSEPLPATILGGASTPTINIGDIQNTGIDANINYNKSVNDNFSFNVGLNFTSYKNKIVDLPDPGYFTSGYHESVGSMSINEEGNAMGSFYGYKVIGIFNSEEEVQNSPTQTAAQAGRFKYQDTNQDGKINDQDRIILGNPNPDYTYGLNLGFKYKNFDFSSLIYGTKGNDIYNTVLAYTDFMSYYQGAKSNKLKNAWTPENTNTTVPKLESTRSFSTHGASNSYFVQDGSYLKLRHVSLGYNITNSKLSKYGISKLRIFAQGVNLFTITNYGGVDPEISSGDPSNFGVDFASYPNNEKGFTIGLNASF
ncbi:SusC/RagA family TonB-linked outer membrane protein [Sphingobacterium rhinopitheci]|uniref:SusC/RagA family TonB-linked outer membrane protein n=1 Tax=Sphingobacterium rhinopitheci TaxID=2781960 RepID=UPI001F516255|nr:TonB-dependent receptor [Sphingobacterium rhinopitheci]MCI0921421.1 TonB-dependent receptor [Sphingobacterium rhinopitheci]